MIRRFIQFEKNCLLDFIGCFWGQMNIVGKIIFSPFTFFCILLLPILMPILHVVMKTLTWKPVSHKRHRVTNERKLRKIMHTNAKIKTAEKLFVEWNLDTGDKSDIIDALEDAFMAGAAFISIERTNESMDDTIC